jgi:tripartite-type tricarboxylate transporter receptor subunit TctC
MGVSGFDYICKMIHDPFVIAVRDDSPFRKIGDLIKAAHERPGKLKMAGGLVKAVQHTAALSFLSQAKVDIIWVPYEGQNDVLIALLGGHADMMHGNPSVILPHVKAGKLRVLATSNPERLSLFPDVVTYKELGIKPVIEGIWRGLVAKRGLPKEALDRLIAAFGQMTKDPEFVKFVESSNAEVIFVAGKNFEEEVRQEVETYR